MDVNRLAKGCPDTGNMYNIMLSTSPLEARGYFHFETDFLAGTKSSVGRIIQVRLRRGWRLKLFKK